MEFQAWQIVVLSLYAGLAIWDVINADLGLNRPVITGFFVGVVLGDPIIGLTVGATLQLMILGVGAYGGASVPDYNTGAILGTAFAISTGKGLEFAIGLAVPVGLLLVQFDVLARFVNTYFQHKAEEYADKKQYKKIDIMNYCGFLSWALSRTVPVLLALTFGNELVRKLLDITPQWLMGGLKVAGGLLPALGIAILLRYLPIKNFMGYLILGFVGAAYVKIPMLGVALIGLALAITVYNKDKETPKVAMASGNVNYTGGVVEDDE